MKNLQEKIRAFLAKCELEEYTDTEEALELLQEVADVTPIQILLSSLENYNQEKKT